MAISGVSPSVANLHPIPAASKPPVTQAQQTANVAPPPAVKPAADRMATTTAAAEST